ncbi:hypothetical protein Sros01_82420 [Streptomyces roseochromogenus]|nr:hypothetical protein Sros01_82420 [Streptomyces roseochromogenus]
MAAGYQEAGGEDYAWTVQRARNIAQTIAFATIDVADPASVTAAERLRDQAMARAVVRCRHVPGGPPRVSPGDNEGRAVERLGPGVDAPSPFRRRW